MKLALIFLNVLYFLVNLQSFEAAEKCGFGKKRCSNGQCIHPYSWCDGIIDCADGSDELFEICEKQRYPNYGYHDCISNKIECDDDNNCTIDCIRFEPEIKRPEPKCYVPFDNFLTLVDVVDNSTLYSNTNAESLISIDYVCTKGSILIGEVKTNFCIGDKWINEHPKCIKMCQPIVDHTIQTICTYEGYEVSCFEPPQPDTKATITCEVGYEEIKEQDGKNEIICQSDGNWDNLPLKCEQICGIVDKENEFSQSINTRVSKVPWNVGIYKKNVNQYFEYICGGTLLRSKIIVTAAHCFWDSMNQNLRSTNLSNFVVTAGKFYRDFYTENELNDIQIRNITYMEKSPIFNVAFFASNIAVLVLDDHIKFNNFIKPACLMTRVKKEEYSIKTGKYGIIAGWGITDNAGEFTQELRSVQLKTIDSDTCINEKKVIHPQYSKDKFCLETVDGKNFCEGDSGGGFLIPETVDNVVHYHIWGIISNGLEWKYASEDKCDGNFITTLSNIQLYEYMVKNAIRKAYNE